MVIHETMVVLILHWVDDDHDDDDDDPSPIATATVASEVRMHPFCLSSWLLGVEETVRCFCRHVMGFYGSNINLNIST